METIKSRILRNLESGPKRYSELLRLEEGSVVGLKKYLRGQIKYIERGLGKEVFRNDKDAQLVMFAYKEFIDSFPEDGDLEAWRGKLLGNGYNDFSRPTVRMYFGTSLRELCQEGKIIKLARGLYGLATWSLIHPIFHLPSFQWARR